MKRLFKTTAAAILIMVLSTAVFATETKPPKKEPVKKEVVTAKRNITFQMSVYYGGGPANSTSYSCYTVHYSMNNGVVSNIWYSVTEGRCKEGLVWASGGPVMPPARNSSEEFDLVKQMICRSENQTPENAETVSCSYTFE